MEIGDIVTVTVDRQLGTHHPKYNDIYYPVNYGYIKGITASDDEEQDAYILGVNKPIDSFTGKVIAVIHRLDDIEDKWVVASGNEIYTVDDIKKAVEFQEKYFLSEIRIKDK
jgi:inorganic pyrophosphatase